LQRLPEEFPPESRTDAFGKLLLNEPDRRRVPALLGPNLVGGNVFLGYEQFGLQQECRPNCNTWADDLASEYNLSKGLGVATFNLVVNTDETHPPIWNNFRGLPRQHLRFVKFCEFTGSPLNFFREFF